MAKYAIYTKGSNLWYYTHYNYTFVTIEANIFPRQTRKTAKKPGRHGVKRDF